MVDYLRYLAGASGRVQIQPYGETFEGRPLLLLTISSPEHLRQLDRIRENVLRLRRVPGSVENEALFKTAPAVVWLSYGVHGNESSSAEAAMQVAYQLAAGTDSLTRVILTRLVVLIDPLLNPDGRDRYVNWYNGTVGQRANPDPNSIEHDEPWPGGRTNHYYFDLNRDWAWLTQKETRARMAIYRQWYPQVHVDFHEMGHESTYFFFPPHGPILQEFPEETRRWMHYFGEKLAAVFDRFGWLYYTAEDFDLFYPGYGDSWPSLNGAIGMTYEQAGGGRGGLVVRRKDGTELTLRDRIHHHFTASMATLAATAERREQRLRDFHKFWVSAVTEAQRADFTGYLLMPGVSKERFTELLKRLQDQGIHLQAITGRMLVKDAQDLITRKRQSVTAREGSVFVPLTQPASRLVRVLFEPRPAITDTFFYDITSWSMPAAFGVKAYRVKRKKWPGLVDWQPQQKASQTGESRARYAYLFHWDDIATAGLLSDLMENGIRCYVTRKPFVLNSESFKPGDIIVPVSVNADVADVHGKVLQLARKWGVDLFRSATALTETGIDLGSRNINWIRPPKIVVAADVPTSSTSYGTLWFLLDQRIEAPFSAVRTARLKRLSLAKYNTLILPDAWGSYASVLDSNFQKKLRGWLREGNTVIGIGAGARFLIDANISVNRVKTEKPSKKDSLKQKREERLKKAIRSWKQKQQERMRDRISGSIFRMVIDTTHPLGFGQEPMVYLLKRGKQTFELSEKVHVVARLPENAHVAGFISDKNAKLLSNSAVVTVEKVGAGRVILFANEMIFRHFWRTTTGLLLNAIFFGSVF
ncbi:MAG: M14 family metallopeptidase [candidate division KSB1 bacterium]|nr:M14 family metallopeptidase [candidate division KSB1 bacterium]